MGENNLKQHQKLIFEIEQTWGSARSIYGQDRNEILRGSISLSPDAADPQRRGHSSDLLRVSLCCGTLKTSKSFAIWQHWLLNLCRHLTHQEDIPQHRFLGPVPRVSDTVGWGLRTGTWWVPSDADATCLEAKVWEQLYFCGWAAMKGN